MKVKIYKGREIIGTAEFKNSKLNLDIEDQAELKKIKDIYTKPHETLVTDEEAEIFTLKKEKFKPKTKKHFEAVSSELWKWGYGHEWES